MKRTYLYSLLALPLLLLVVYLAVIPSSTRATFLSEFSHKIALLFGHEPEPMVGADGKKGLRLESPEEYGPQPGSVEESIEPNAAREEKDEVSED